MLSAHRLDQVTDAEQATGDLLTSGALMQRAAGGLATACLRRLSELRGRVYGARVVLLVGSGDNGGDALFAGARLAGRGAGVVAVPTGDRVHEAGAAALLAAGGRLLSGDDASDPTRVQPLLAGADLVLDGMVGIGARGGLRSGAQRLAAALERADVVARTVAVDVPSGVDAATGAVAGEGEGAAVRAALTVTFGTYKPGLLVLPGAGYVGRLELVGIGLELPEPDLTALQEDDVLALLPQPGEISSKYTRGVIGVVAGSEVYPGAAVLCTGGALRGGAGYVRFASTAHPAEQVRQRFPEVVVTEVDPGDPGRRAEATLGAGRVQAWVAGSGLGTDASATAVIKTLLETELPVLVDADGLTIVAGDRSLLAGRAGKPTLLTPHEGEFARLVGGDAADVRADLAADRLGTVRRVATELGVTVLLKGSTTLVVDPDGRARVNRTGTGWLATAGSGDVLSGVCGALLAAGLSPLDAGCVGAYLHGLAGGIAAVPPAAEDVLRALPAAWAVVRGGSRQGSR